MSYKYRPEFCQIVVDAMRNGASVESIGCKLVSDEFPNGVSRATVYVWIKEIPEFAAAIDSGNQLAQLRLEEKVMNKAMGEKNAKMIDFNSAAFLLKTRFHKTYSEKISHDVSAQGININIDKDDSGL